MSVLTLIRWVESRARSVFSRGFPDEFSHAYGGGDGLPHRKSCPTEDRRGRQALGGAGALACESEARWQPGPQARHPQRRHHGDQGAREPPPRRGRGVDRVGSPPDDLRGPPHLETFFLSHRFGRPKDQDQPADRPPIISVSQYGLPVTMTRWPSRPRPRSRARSSRTSWLWCPSCLVCPAGQRAPTATPAPATRTRRNWWWCGDDAA
jgi:hypothetical protein